jgi:glyoxylase-like metal-dependent hydrolase (beta-lactamase superfamily II)
MILRQSGKIADNLYVLGEPELPVFLLRGAAPSLFDSGMSFMGPRYLSALHGILGDAGKLRYLFLTHSHFDHCGAAAFLKRNIEDLKIGASRVTAETLRKPNAIQLIQTLNSPFLAGARDAADLVFNGLDVDILLEDGQEFQPDGGPAFGAIATPGHTRDSVTFYIPGLKALIPGEAVGVYDLKYVISAEFLSSYTDYMASLEKLAGLDIDIIMMSHIFILTGEDAKGYIRKSIARTKEFRQEILDSLDEFNGDRNAVKQKIYKKDYVDTGAIPQPETAYLINLEAKIRVIAEGK